MMGNIGVLVVHRQRIMAPNTQQILVLQMLTSSATETVSNDGTKLNQRCIYRIVSSAICNKGRQLLSLLLGTVLMASIIANEIRAKM